MMKNAFRFMLKALFVLLRYLNVCLDIFEDLGKQLDKKVTDNFKIYDVTDWETNNCKAGIAQYLEKKGNRTMKFGQFIECNMRNIFLEKSYTKCGGKASPDSFIKNQNLWINSLKCYKVCFYFMFNSRSTKIY